MIWYSIIGSLLGFLASVIFGAALIKPSQQVRDENGTYFNGNPFTTQYDLDARKSYMVAFLLLITGFSLSIGGEIGGMFAVSSHLIAVSVSITLSLLGYLGTALLLLFKIRKHQDMRNKLARRAFQHQVESHRHELRQDSFRTKQFDVIKKEFVKHLLERYGAVPEYDNENERALISDYKSSNNWQDLLEASERYLLFEK